MLRSSLRHSGRKHMNTQHIDRHCKHKEIESQHTHTHTHTHARTHTVCDIEAGIVHTGDSEHTHKELLKIEGRLVQLLDQSREKLFWKNVCQVVHRFSSLFYLFGCVLPFHLFQPSGLLLTGHKYCVQTDCRKCP